MPKPIMKQSRLRSLAIIFCSLAIGAASAADDPVTVTLQARYAAMKIAMEAHDSAAISAVLAPDFVSVDVSGRSKNGSQMISEVVSLKSDPNRSSHTTLISVDLNPPLAVVHQRYEMTTIKTDSDGTQHKIGVTALSTDIWVKSAGDWLIERTATEEMSLFQDGATVLHVKR
jgi:ketosteroid isomerase-like protein